MNSNCVGYDPEHEFVTHFTIILEGKFTETQTIVQSHGQCATELTSHLLNFMIDLLSIGPYKYYNEDY